MNVLCKFAESKTLKLRRVALEILRNFAFNTNNRSALLTSSDFIRVCYNILEEKTYAEKLIITVAIWKLIAQNNKAKNVIKNSPIYGKLRQSKESVDRLTHGSKQTVAFNSDNETAEGLQETIEDLATSLKCVMDILQA